MRIVSLLPSATEIICGLGLRKSLVGVSHECDYPPDVVELPKVTQTLIPSAASSGKIDLLVQERLKAKSSLYSLDLDVLRSVEPDLIVTQGLCDVCAVSESEVSAAARGLSRKPKIINLEPSNFADVMDCIHTVGCAAGHEREAKDYFSSLHARVEAVADRSKLMSYRPSVMLLEWIDPPFSAGHWNPELVELAGGREVIGSAGQRSAKVPWAKIVEADPELLMIACCGFDVSRTFKDLPILKSYPGWSSLRCVRSERVYVMDGSSYFSRPGPRLVDSLEILAHALDCDVHPLPGPLPEACCVRESLH